MNQYWSGNECERNHTLMTTTTGSQNSQKEANNQTSNQNSVLCPQRTLPYGFMVLDEVKCKAHTQQSTSSSESLRPINLTENAPKGHFQGSLLLL